MKNCREIIKLVSEIDDIGSLPLMQRVELRFHTALCRYCSWYVRHLRAIREGFRRYVEQRTRGLTPEQISEIEDQVIRDLKKTGSDTR